MDLDNNNTRRVFLSRHGESINNLYGKIGGDALLSNQGGKYARSLAVFMANLHIPDLKVWTSQLKRTQQTVKFLDIASGGVMVEPAINEISAGEHDDLTYEQIADQYPVEFAQRDKDKLSYRYPGGESYLDVLSRLEPVVDRMVEEEDNLLVVSHQATLRCVIGLLLGKPLEEVPYIKVPLHTVMEVRLPSKVQNARVLEILEHRLPVECVDTYRAKPINCSLNRGAGEACTTVPGHM